MRELEKEQEKEIRENWFKDHVAKLTTHGDLQVLEWRKPDTNIFAVRYVFDGYHLYVTGDLGEAVFRFTERAYPERQWQYDLDYFEEKLRAFTDARRDFDQGRAKEYLAERKADMEDWDQPFDEGIYKELLSLIDQSSTIRDWEAQLYSFDIGRVSSDAYEWLPGIGEIIPMRVRSYLIGLKMAHEQLVKMEAVSVH